MKKITGFTLIELLVFIIVSGIVTSLLIACYLTLLKDSPSTNRQIEASQAARKCMDWYLGQRFINGSSSLTCNSPTPQFCTNNIPTGYIITGNVNCSTYYGNSTNYKTITVAVTGPGNASLSTIITVY